MAKKRKSNNRIIYFLGGLAVVLLIIVVVGRSQGWIGKKKQIEVEISEVERATIIEKISASGTVQPVVEVKISPEVSGEIIELLIHEGDSVSKGEYLLRIRPDNFISALRRTRANLNQRKAGLAQARSNLAKAQAFLTRAEQDFKRQKNLYKQKVISEADFQVTETNYKIAKEDIESARQNVEASKYIVQSAIATVTESRENLRLTQITAPMSGIVSKLSVEIGETVLGTSQMQGTEIMRISDLSNMEVRVDVNENVIIRISEGDTTVIDVDSYSYTDKSFKGIVTQIANSANDKLSPDAVTEFEVRIEILNDSYTDIVSESGSRYPFRPGMTASVEIITETKKKVLSVPLASVTTRVLENRKDRKNNDKNDGTADENVSEVVFVYENGIVNRRVVETGISDFERIQILSGIKEGEKLVSGPFLAVSKRLKDGSEVKEKEVKQEETDEGS